MSTNGNDRSVGTGFPKLYQNKTKSTGGYNIKATQNMPFELVTPMIHNVTVRGTNISAEMRTITGQSMSGNEIPYIDNGYSFIAINFVSVQNKYLEYNLEFFKSSNILPKNFYETIHCSCCSICFGSSCDGC